MKYDYLRDYLLDAIERLHSIFEKSVTLPPASTTKNIKNVKIFNQHLQTICTSLHQLISL